MKTELLQQALDDLCDSIADRYIQNQNDPDYDINLDAYVVIDRGTHVQLVPLPMDLITGKEHLSVMLRHIATHRDEAPAMFHGIALTCAGFKSDPETHERIGEIAMVSIETDEGQHAEAMFDVTRAYNQCHAVLADKAIHETMTQEPGLLQGFFPPPSRH